MIRIRFFREARRELLAAAVYYHESAADLGVRFANAVEKSLAIAARFPSAGSPGPEHTRKVMVKGFPYSIVYLEEHTGIAVVAVVHHSRRPGYWISRLEGT
ncbi:MAG: type II toxin-antitoxin system RelE/ParE family toxin [Thermodesulfobacteriota bacterium]